MEWIILAIALLLMAPAAVLPLFLSAQETMEADLRGQQPAAPTQLVRPVRHQSGAPTIEQPTAA